MVVTLQGAQMLQVLEKSLRKSLPESLKVYGTIYHVSHGNPFKLKALVDKWPDFNTVVVRPQEQDMTDDLDYYANTYQIYSKDPQNCQGFLGSPEVINWRQHLQIQSSQSSLNKVVQNLATAKSFEVNHSENLLYVSSHTIKNLFPSVIDPKSIPPNGVTVKAINQDVYKLSSLDVTNADLVDKFWLFGGNEKSKKFIKRCIQNFPSSCMLGPEGTPVSWTLMDQTGEMRMGGTLPEHRSQGLVSFVVYSQEQTMRKLGFPIYSHTTTSNIAMQKLSTSLQHLPMPCAWNQWKCVPV